MLRKLLFYFSALFTPNITITGHNYGIWYNPSIMTVFQLSAIIKAVGTIKMSGKHNIPQ